MQPKNRNQTFVAIALSLMLSTVFASFAKAQTNPTGTITGHVFNPVNKEYIRDAEVHLEGTNVTVPTESGGYFTLDHVPAGKANVTVSYTGFAPTTAEIFVTAGQVATHEFELGGSAAEKPANDANMVKLEAIVVSAEKDGNAKALQRQRNSMNMSRSVASDAFGNVTEGNVGEFLKYLPGVELEYSEADTRGPRLGGMSSEYASVTLDGKGIASADAFSQYTGFENSAAGTANRSFGFDSISISSIESIEINRVTPASSDANAPAGNINLKAKKAFDRKGRHIGISVGTVLNSDEFTLKKTQGPNDGGGRKFKPNYTLSYSDVMFDNKLGIKLDVQESNLYNEQYRMDHTYNRTPTATDPRPQVLTSLVLKDGPKWTERGSYAGTIDFRATPHLTLSFSSLYARYLANFYNRQYTLQAATNNTTANTGRQLVLGDGVLSFNTNPLTTASTKSVAFGGGNGAKFTNTLTLAPSFIYRRGSVTVDGSYTSSHSRNDYDNLGHSSTVANTPVNSLTGIEFTAQRSSDASADWVIHQTGGPDWTDLSLQTNPRISDDNRQNTIDVKSGDLNLKYVLPTRLPAYIQTGIKRARNFQTATDTRSYDVWQFIGPGGGTTGSFVNYPSPVTLFAGKNQPDVNFFSLNGGGSPPFPNRDALGRLFKTNPEYFLRSLPTSATAAGSSGMTLANYEAGRYTQVPTYDITETISAAYVMANTRIKNLQVQGGVRFEETDLKARELNPFSNQQVAAAGFPVTSAGAPNSVSAIDYKYSRPRVTRQSDYHNFFPSVTAKYNFTPSLMGDFGWGKAIRRPNIKDITGTRSINDDALQVTTPNPGLKPELSEKYAGSLSYFFGKSGVNNLQVVASHNVIKNRTVGATLTSEQYGNDDPLLADYDFISFSNSPLPVTYNSMEYSYQQYLAFLPRWLGSTSVNLAYTRTYTKTPPGIITSGVIPNSVKGTVAWRYNRFKLNFSAIWQDDSGPFLNAANRYQKANTKCDLSGSIKLSERYSFYFAGRNVFEVPHLIMETSAGNPPVLFRYENYGTNWSFGLNGNF
jgi:iron complex outermembrane receptor protein